jgi:hypothetical protein
MDHDPVIGENADGLVAQVGMAIDHEDAGFHQRGTVELRLSRDTEKQLVWAPK